MKIDASEVVVGLVVTLDSPAMFRDPRVTNYRCGVVEDKPRPYLCVDVRDGVAIFAPLTTRPGARTLRLELVHGWRTGGQGPNWRSKFTKVYLVDGAALATGPVAAFVEHSSGEQSDPGYRRSISAQGVEAVRAKVAANTHRLTRVASRPVSG